jgi:predicted NAD/FAD-binding protein
MGLVLMGLAGLSVMLTACTAHKLAPGGDYAPATTNALGQVSYGNDYPLFVTLNPSIDIPPELVFDRHDFEHPVFTREAIAAQARIPELQGVQNTWFAGAYQRYGFHEDGLLSAVNVSNQMGVKAPWQ